MPNDAIINSGPYEVGRLRRRRDRRVAEYLFRRSIRTSNPEPEMSACRLIKLLLYLTIFYVVLGAFATGLVLLLIEHHILPDMPGSKKFPGLASAPGKPVGDEKQIVWSPRNEKELGIIRREMSHVMDPYGLIGMKRMMGCNLDDSWGYMTSRPCILLKITQALGFQAVTYDDALTLPDYAPDELFDYVVGLGTEDRLNRIWLSCQVMEPGLNIQFDYVPDRFFDAVELFTSGNVFLNESSDNDGGTYKEDPRYRRIIGVQLSNIPPNRNIKIHCKAWAKNIPLYMVTIKFLVRLAAPVHPTTPLVLDEWYE
ncbi:uncharacterized protein LOC6553957 [Drosophila erecta]|uniref:GG16097 n=1 Tax=Drosophila erecta TaxID=7220 RepID=B3P358_DROER|nr:uncharacterized protein LOC6553957 [Drosophila erecta]EDV48510.1 uncharacterized protein Dere_GG16097 [Drosophila erecta]